MFQHFYQSFSVCIKRTNYNWYHRYIHVSYFFRFLVISWYLSLFEFLQFYTGIWRDDKVHNRLFLFFFSWLLLGLVIWPTLGDSFYFKIPQMLVRLILQEWFWVVHVPFVNMVKLKLLARFPVDHHPIYFTTWVIVLFLSNSHAKIRDLSAKIQATQVYVFLGCRYVIYKVYSLEVTLGRMNRALYKILSCGWDTGCFGCKS